MFNELTPEALSRFRALYFALAKDTPHSVLLDSCGKYTRVADAQRIKAWMEAAGAGPRRPLPSTP